MVLPGYLSSVPNSGDRADHAAMGPRPSRAHTGKMPVLSMKGFSLSSSISRNRIPGRYNHSAAAEDRATLGSDPSAAAVAERQGGIASTVPPVLSTCRWPAKR
jgi:hypothetical protein